jgi:hypothetical protein
MVEDAAYAGGDAWARLKLLADWERQKMISNTRPYLFVLGPEAIAVDTAATAPPRRGAAILKAMAKLRETSPDAANMQSQLRSTFALHFLYDPAYAKADPPARLAMIAAMQKQGLIDESRQADLETPVVVKMLQADPAFVSADDAGKAKMIDALAERKAIGFFTKGNVKSKLNLRQ